METGTMPTSAATVPPQLKSRQHYEILDGLRGIAAIVVVIFHFMEEWITDYSKNFVGHGYLAVDFFFVLSGFVIAYAYDERMQRVSIKEFLVSRLIRLQPMVIFGAILGLVTFLWDPFVGLLPGYSPGKIALVFVTTMLMIPYPAITERFGNLFSFNAPAWSLFWEYIANIIYGVILWRLDRRILAALTVVAAGLLGWVAFRAGGIGGGWGAQNFWDGGARLFYSFSAGMVIYRYKLIIPNRLGFPGIGLLLCAALFIPFFPKNWLVEASIAIIYFPLLISLGAGAQLKSWLAPLCRFLGRLSYPLYMVHFGFIWIFVNYLKTQKPDTNTLIVVITLGVIAMIALGWLSLVLVDEPVRKWLQRKRSAKATK
ncbi:peptidoglycan/LPS O-acetylase OafA/YrhL [Chitinophaga dinghuensis]|uniref:Peptidoglycan/LPS O-acetylase OafA/YrhL n=1 Tax=Chitinophaga dinghuensis TaxID=1539050 RepID=A0A327VML2_9BACT|nr:acyltransferase [Chitinophaga dinghuensis]RAJ76571.1 peptidoglycan/LPS O-acetylase OafA/YrhL [Chitinophaga dinghuensis]